MNTAQSEAPINTEGFIGREITDHKNNRFNRECINVVTADLRAIDNAHHRYKIFVNRDAQTSDEPPRITLHQVELVFQNGGLREAGPNGITDQALLAVVLDRLRSFNDGPFRCRENSLIITKLEEAMMWMEKRSNDRSRRGVEGERVS
jgi:hypothetical protein